MREYTKEEADAIAARMNRKADRRESWAEGRSAKADQAWDASRKATAGIPFGQPILVDHYSAKRHRSALKRSQDAADRGLEHSKMAKEHDRKAKAQRAWAAEVQRRADGPRYSKADLLPGDRLCTKDGVLDSVAVRVNAKSITAKAVYSQSVTDLTEPTPIWGHSKDGNPGRMPYLRVRSAYRLIDGVWTLLEGWSS